MANNGCTTAGDVFLSQRDGDGGHINVDLGALEKHEFAPQVSQALLSALSELAPTVGAGSGDLDDLAVCQTLTSHAHTKPFCDAVLQRSALTQHLPDDLDDARRFKLAAACLHPRNVRNAYVLRSTSAGGSTGSDVSSNGTA